MSRATDEVDKRYLWALEVLALHELEGDMNPKDLHKAREIVTNANLDRPRKIVMG